VESGKQKRFWEDVWLEECSLQIAFPHLNRFFPRLGDMCGGGWAKSEGGVLITEGTLEKES
jgi:hypothetical protein